jgi:hypothetical protein
LYSSIYDRYLLLLLPIAILAMLKLYKERISSHLPLASYAVMAVFGLYTIAATHDWFALNRARVIAVNELHETGVPVTRIQAGFEYDGWTQLSVAPSVGGRWVRIPAGAPPIDPPKVNVASDCVLTFAQYAPAIEPEYFVVFSSMPCLAPSGFEPIRYSTWLPPFHRSIEIQRLPNHADSRSATAY